MAEDLDMLDISSGDEKDILGDFRYIFKNEVTWYADEAMTIEFDFTQEITENITIYGEVFKKDSYTFNFYIGDTLHSTASFANGSSITYPTDIVTEPGKGVFWSREKDEWNQFLGNAHRDTNLYAFFFDMV